MRNLDSLKITVRKEIEKHGRVSRDLIWQICFQKYKISQHDIEMYYFPVLNSAYLSPKNLLDVILKECPYKFRNFLLSKNEKMTESDLRAMYSSYLEERSFTMYEEDCRNYLVDELYSDYEFGVISGLVHIGLFDLYVGSLCTELLRPEILRQKLFQNIAVGISGAKPVLLDFMDFASGKELERTIRVLLLLGEGAELTERSPVYRGESVYAIRPPVDEWGLAIRKGDQKKWAREFAFSA